METMRFKSGNRALYEKFTRYICANESNASANVILKFHMVLFHMSLRIRPKGHQKSKEHQKYGMDTLHRKYFNYSFTHPYCPRPTRLIIFTSNSVHQ